MMDHLISELQLDACRLHRIMELGCGTGVCGAAWALRATSLGTPELIGMDINRWALTEAQATWKSVGLRGKTKLRSMVEFPKTEMQDAIVAGYSVNELPDGPRASLLRNLRRAHHRGATILILENVAKRPVPWWDTWAAFKERGGRETPGNSDLIYPRSCTPRQSKRQRPLSSQSPNSSSDKGQPMNPAIKQILSNNQDLHRILKRWLK